MDKKWYESSSGTGDLSLTLKGVLITFIPLMIFVGQQFNVQLTQEYLMQGIQLFAELVGLSIVVAGLVRKGFVWIKGLARK